MKRKLWIPICLGVFLVSGCNNTKETASTSPTTTPNTQVAGTPATTSTPRLTSKVQSPSDPKEVVRLFFDSMRQGNGEQISALLTSAAREEIRRKELKIDPMGSPLATFEIGEQAVQGDGILISSIWSEPEHNGQPAAELEVVWELRKEPEGWRICGMAVDPQTGEEVQVVNFEHLEQDPTQEQRVASLPNAPVDLPQQSSPNGLQGTPPGATYPPAQTPNGLPPSSGYAPQGLPPANQPLGQNNGGFQQSGLGGGLPEVVPANSPSPGFNQGGVGLPPPGSQPGSYDPRVQPAGNQLRR